jgi:hypothetical protein
MTQHRPPKVPCGSCPYRKDVPSGVWERHEYDKLLAYDGSMIEQIGAGGVGLFMCHQRDGNLCGGWLACHGPRNLAAMRLAASVGRVGEEAFDYRTDVKVFKSGAAARRHGIKDVEKPGRRANKMIDGLVRKRAKGA